MIWWLRWQWEYYYCGAFWSWFSKQHRQLHRLDRSVDPDIGIHAAPTSAGSAGRYVQKLHDSRRWCRHLARHHWHHHCRTIGASVGDRLQLAPIPGQLLRGVHGGGEWCPRVRPQGVPQHLQPLLGGREAHPHRPYPARPGVWPCGWQYQHPTWLPGGIPSKQPSYMVLFEGSPSSWISSKCHVLRMSGPILGTSYFTDNWRDGRICRFANRITKVISPNFRIGVEKQKLHVKITFSFTQTLPPNCAHCWTLQWCLLSVYMLYNLIVILIMNE